MTRFVHLRPLVIIAVTSFLLNWDAALAQSAPPREIIIRYRAGKEAPPPPHRAGNTYVISIPRALQPAPEKLAAPFANNVEGDNEVWRFEISDNTSVKVAELDNGTIRVRLEDGSATAQRQVLSRHEVVQPAPETHPEIAKHDRAPKKIESTFTPTPDRAPSSLNVNANGSALTLAVATESASDNAKEAKLPRANLDLSVPTSPAFAILGITPDNVIRPTSPRELGMALLNGVGPDGTFQSGVAIDTAPYLLLAGKNKTLADYRDHYSIRFLSRTQFSFATAKGAQDKDPSLKLALGLHFIFFDNGDPRLDDVYINELQSAYDDLGFIDPEDPGAEGAARVKWQAATAKARKDAKARNWNRSSWSLGIAPSWIDKTGDSGNYDWNGGAVWTSFAYGFDTEPFLDTGLDKNSQLIVHLRYRNHEEIPDPAATGTFYTQDNALAALRLRMGSPEFNVSLDASYVRAWNSGLHDGHSWRAAMVLERKMAPNLWFRLSYGKELDTPDNKDSSLVLGSFHLGASPEATLPGIQ